MCIIRTVSLLTESVHLPFHQVGDNECCNHCVRHVDVVHSLDKLFTFTSRVCCEGDDDDDVLGQVYRQEAEAQQGDAHIFVENIQDRIQRKKQILNHNGGLARIIQGFIRVEITQ